MSNIVRFFSALSIFFLVGCELVDTEVPESVPLNTDFEVRLRLIGSPAGGGIAVELESEIVLCLASLESNDIKSAEFKIKIPDSKNENLTLYEGMAKEFAPEGATQKLKEEKKWKEGMVTRCFATPKLNVSTAPSRGKALLKINSGKTAGVKEFQVVLGTSGNYEVVGDFSTKVGAFEDFGALTGEYLVRMGTPMDWSRTSGEVNLLETLSPSRNIYLVRGPAVSKNSLRKVRSYFSRYSNDVVVEPNHTVRLIKPIPSERAGELNQLWGMKCLFGVCAEKAWNKSKGSKKIRVAVIDTGIDPKHEALKANLWINEKEINGKAGMDDDGNGYIDDIHGYSVVDNTGDFADPHGHGTHVSGTIGANHPDADGLKGVNWDVTLMAVQVFGKEGSATTATIIKAYEYILKTGADVINMSYGGLQYSKIEEGLLRELVGKGTTLVAASGNDGLTGIPHFPSGYAIEGLISVGALTSIGESAQFSNYHVNRVDVYAPGKDILSSVPNNSYQSFSGTSMATPHVAGSVALLKSVSPNLSPIQIQKLVRDSSDKMPALSKKCAAGGRVNANRLLNQELNSSDPNEPSQWSQKMLPLESEHPYKMGMKEWDVEVPGAKEISLFLDKAILELDFDHLEIYDGNNTLVTKLTGEHLWTNSYSPVIKGSKAKLKLVTDNDFHYYGIKLSKVAHH